MYCAATSLNHMAKLITNLVPNAYKTRKYYQSYGLMKTIAIVKPLQLTSINFRPPTIQTIKRKLNSAELTDYPTSFLGPNTEVDSKMKNQTNPSRQSNPT